MFSPKQRILGITRYVGRCFFGELHTTMHASFVVKCVARKNVKLIHAFRLVRMVWELMGYELRYPYVDGEPWDMYPTRPRINIFPRKDRERIIVFQHMSIEHARGAVRILREFPVLRIDETYAGGYMSSEVVGPASEVTDQFQRAAENTGLCFTTRPVPEYSRLTENDGDWKREMPGFKVVMFLRELNRIYDSERRTGVCGKRQRNDIAEPRRVVSKQ